VTPTRVRTVADGEEIVFTEVPFSTGPGPRSGETDPRDVALARRMKALSEAGAKGRTASPPAPLRPRDAD